MVSVGLSDYNERQLQYKFYLKKICEELAKSKQINNYDWKSNIGDLISKYSVYCSQYIKKNSKEEKLIQKVGLCIAKNDRSKLIVFIEKLAGVKI